MVIYESSLMAVVLDVHRAQRGVLEEDRKAMDARPAEWALVEGPEAMNDDPECGDPFHQARLELLNPSRF
jgi:hypothetical protein